MKSGETSGVDHSDDNDYEVSKDSEVMPTRRLRRNRKADSDIELPSSSEESYDRSKSRTKNRRKL